jgi:hypothetical protein
MLIVIKFRDFPAWQYLCTRFKETQSEAASSSSPSNSENGDSMFLRNAGYILHEITTQKNFIILTAVRFSDLT